jgi:hypothetical protein
MKFPTTSLLLLLTLVTSSPVARGKEEAPAKGFDKTLSLQGLTFHVKCPNQGSTNKLTITPEGLEGDDSPIVVEVDGSVTHTEVGDLDANGFPEIYIYVQGAGSGSYGSLIAYAANKKQSLSPIFFPDLTEDKVNSKGYMGHDAFTLVKGTFERRFPLYNQGDTNTKPTGKTRQLQYKLKSGEAGWILRLVKAIEY